MSEGTKAIQETFQQRGAPSFVWRAGQERRLALVEQWAELQGRRVLDAGCGVGTYMAAFQTRGAMIYGVEIETDRAAEARQVTERVCVAAVEALPFAPASFDVIFSHEVLEHVSDDRRAVQEMARCVRPGGRVVIFTPNRWYPFETHGIEWRGQYHFGNIPLVNYLPDRWRNRLCPHARAYTRRQIRALLADTPLRIMHHTQIYPGFDNLVARWPRAGGLVRALFHFLERTPLRFFGLSHFVVAVREE